MKNKKQVHRYNIDLRGCFADIAYCLEDIHPSSLGYHYHEGYEIMQIWSEQGNILIEDKIYPIGKGNIYIINASECHCSNPDSSIPYSRSKVTFSTPYIHSILEPIGQLCLLEPFLIKSTGATNCIVPEGWMIDKFNYLFKEIADESSSGNEVRIATMTACILEMLVLVYRWYKEHSAKTTHSIHNINEHVQRTLDYVNLHLFEGLNIEKICEELHLSKYYLCHLFKAITGLTLMQYIIERRVSAAKKLLTHTNEAISKIAIDTGFGSFSIFSRCFRRITGHTSSEFRRNYSLQIKFSDKHEK